MTRCPAAVWMDLNSQKELPAKNRPPLSPPLHRFPKVSTASPVVR
jgi:hypothetical protein